MDPDSSLKEQLELASDILGAIDGAEDDGDLDEQALEQLVLDAVRLAELVQALNQWIYNGGYLPKCWQPK